MARHQAAHHAGKHKNDKTDPFNYILYFFTVATPLFEVPQAYAIYSNQSAENVSVYTWGFFALASIVCLTYAIRNRLRPLIVMYSLYILVESVIVVGIVLYR